MRFLKRALDVVLALVLLIPLAPLFILLGVLTRLDSPGPIFYKGLRIGLNGRPFRMFKFRTMVLRADRMGGPSTADDDPRITRAGRFLRKYKLDELPQILNVLRGEMSFVGPRPEVPGYVELFTGEERSILTVRPGITDWASLWNPDEGALLTGAADPEKVYLERIRPQKIRLQLRYVREQSLTNDFLILFETGRIVLRRAFGASPMNSRAGHVAHG